MADRDLTLAMRLRLDAQQWVRGLNASDSTLKKFTTGARSEIERLRAGFAGMRGKLAGFGVGIGAGALVVQSARLDKSLTQIGLTAGVSKGQVAGLRKELFAIAREFGPKVEDLQSGFDNLIQAGQKWDEALRTIRATSIATAVTGARPDVLTSGLSVGSQAFKFDLAKPGQALDLLDKMTMAGRLGSAELENLSAIFSRIGVNAQSAGMGFEQTLAFVEGLSTIEKQPERLATLADSTLRLFNNASYRRQLQAASGVKFFDAKGEQRDALAVLADIKKKYDTFTTDKQRADFFGRFKNFDLDTTKGLRTLLGGDLLSTVDTFTRRIKDAGGTLQQDLPEAINNGVDQVGRLKGVLRETADDFAKRLNAGVTPVIKKLLDSKEQGGLDLSGGQILGGIAAAGLGALLLKRFGGKLLGGLAGGAASLTAGVGMGQALKQLGVTPVFVTGVAPGLSLGGTSTPAGAAADKAVDAATAAAGGAAAGKWLPRLLKTVGGGLGSTARFLGYSPVGQVALAGAGGYALGTAAYKAMSPELQTDIGEALQRIAAFFGNDAARENLQRMQQYEHNLHVEISDTRTRVTKLKSGDPKTNITAEAAGPRGAMP